MENRSFTFSENGVTAEDRQTDMELVEAVRTGNEDAYAELWKRHYASAVRVAQSITTTFDPDDMVQEAFSSLLIAIRRGEGPHTAFRAYLMTSVKNIAMTWARARREMAAEDLESHLDPIDSDFEIERQIDRCITREAFLSLPERWQRVLWHTEIEEMSTAEVAEIMGIKPGAVAQLAFRAREGLRESWLSSHLRVTEGSTEECRWVIKRAGAYARGNASSRDAARIEKHLEHCPSCPQALKEARSVNKRLLMLLPPIAAGGTAISAATALSGAEGAVAAVPGTATGESAGPEAILPPPEWSEPVKGGTDLTSFLNGKPVLIAAISVILLVAATLMTVAMNTGHSTEPAQVASVPLLEPTLEPAPGTPSSQPSAETHAEVEGLLPSHPPQASLPRTNDPATEPSYPVSSSAKPEPTPTRSPKATPVPEPVPSASTTTTDTQPPPAVTPAPVVPTVSPGPVPEATPERQPLVITLRSEYVEGGIKYLRMVFFGERSATVAGYLDGVEQTRVVLNDTGAGEMLLILPQDSLPHATAGYP